MRSAAALLFVTLIGPSIISALCAFTCVYREHHSPHAATHGCHEQHSSNDGPVVAGLAAAFCHDEAETFTTTVAEARLLKAAPVAVVLPAGLAAYDQRLLIQARNRSSGPPGFVRQTTPLRI